MSGDYSRVRFEARYDISGVLMQQGRVQLDSEWNEWVAVMDRRLRAESVDTLGVHPTPGLTGVAVVSPQTPDAFKIDASGGNITIGRGRMYVDGLLAENHGGGTLEFDPVLAELRGQTALPYNQQPYFATPPALPPLPSGGPHLAYLEVWRRELTHLQQPNLLESAVGVDTTMRWQTVWQVRFLANIGGVDCNTPDGKFPAWQNLIRPSGARMSIRAEGVPPDQDPCELPPTGGYRGLENQLYRIEIHDGGGIGTATFKWSRENASVTSNVVEIVAHTATATELKLASLGRDAVLRFNSGNWVEILDDRRELAGENHDPASRRGELRKITVDDAKQTISFTPALPPDLIPAGGNDTLAARHTRVQRWDQKGTVRDADNNIIIDLDAPSSTGLIPVPAPGVWVVLENGVQVEFSLASPGSAFRSGDYWLSAARSADTSVETYTARPPRGIQRHYARLAIVTFPSAETDCRNVWPPEVSAEGCACTVCVSADEHNSGKLSLQTAIDEVIKAGGGTICLEVGKYVLKEPLRIQKARSLRIVGKGEASEIQAEQAGFEVHAGMDIGFETFSLTYRGSKSASGILLRSSTVVRLQHLAIKNENKEGPGVALSGALEGILIRDNMFAAPIGISSVVGPDGGGTGLADLHIENNQFDCQQVAVALTGASVHQQLSRLTGNQVRGCSEAGFLLTGATVPGFGMEILGNEFQVLGNGIVAGVNGLRIKDNNLIPVTPSPDNKQDGIVLTQGMNQDRLDECQIVGNRIVGQIIDGKKFGFTNAILAKIPLGTVAIVHNQVADAQVGLLVAQSVERLSVENNQMSGMIGAATLLEKGDGGYVSMCDNQLEIIEGLPGVRIICRKGDCIFTNNRVVHRKSDGKVAVEMIARTLAVGSNCLVGKARMKLDPGIGIVNDRKEPLCTVLGNITGGDILVNGSPLAPPWMALNLQNVA